MSGEPIINKTKYPSISAAQYPENSLRSTAPPRDESHSSRRSSAQALVGHPGAPSIEETWEAARVHERREAAQEEAERREKTSAAARAEAQTRKGREAAEASVDYSDDAARGIPTADGSTALATERKHMECEAAHRRRLKTGQVRDNNPTAPQSPRSANPIVGPTSPRDGEHPPPRKRHRGISWVAKGHRDGAATHSTPPPPSASSSVGPFPNTHTDRNRFPGIIHGILSDPTLTLYLIRFLPISSIFSLYCVSKPFHYVFNTHMTTYILAIARANFGSMLETTPWHCYQTLCINDPVRRTLVERSEGESENGASSSRYRWEGTVRNVPSWKYISFLAHRHTHITTILTSLQSHGLRLPLATHITLSKLWFTLDIPHSAGRIALFHNARYWTGADLVHASMLFMKVDMCFCDPVEGADEAQGAIALRKMLLGQRTLTVLSDVLTRKRLTTRIELARMALEFDGSSAPSERALPGHHTVFGLPLHRIGKTSLEGWGEGARRLVGLDECVMKESVRRRLELHKSYLDYLIWGFVRPGQDLPDVDPVTAATEA